MLSTRSSRRPHPLRRLLALTLLVVASVLVGTPALAQDAESFPDLDPARHVYDLTGSSLDAAGSADVEARIERLAAAGADVVVVVRALDVDSDDTFDQVEALQQEWVRVSGTDEDRAVAVLVNRNPDDPTDARAGVFVGQTYAEGNVPDGEQRDIVEDALIPPLRDGDVRAGLVAALDRLESSIRSGPPVSAFDRFAAGAARSWLPWTALGLAAVGLVAALVLHRGRSRGHHGVLEPTTTRPDELSPALGGALVAGGPPMQVVPAVLLDLAGRGAVAIEAESEGGWASSPKVRVRLRERGAVRDEVERAVWEQLSEKADDGVVSSGALASAATWSGPVREAVRAQMRERGWLDPRAAVARGLLAVIAGVTLVAAVFALVLSAVGSGPLVAWVGVVALFAVAAVAFVLLFTYPALTPAGLKAAAPWTAYRDGLKAAAEDDDARLDLDRVLPDAVALGLGDALGDKLKAATEAGVPLRAFTSGDAHLAAFPWWIAFSSSTAGTSSSGTVSGAGAGGGGGAAGST